MKSRPRKKTPFRNRPFSLSAAVRRRVAYTFMASLGLWMPQTYGAVLVDLDATQLPEGPLAAWTNRGSIGGNFAAPANAVPSVATVQSVKGVRLNPSGTVHYYTGPAAPFEVTGGGTRTVEAWIHNPATADEETIFAWGRRGGPDGSNCSFNHGLNTTFGAVGHWGAGPDIGWNGKIVANRWTYVAYTYDGLTASVYMDGELANSEPVVLDTWGFDNTAAGNPLPFRVGAQNDANGNPTTGLRGTMTIARIRVHDTPLTEQEIKARFDQEKGPFGLGDADSDGLPDWYERQFAFLNVNDATDAAKDQDNDGLTNFQEFRLGTAPNNPDSDSDGVNDGAEVNRTANGVAAPTDPLKADTDGDALSDKVETGTGRFVNANDTGTDPLKADTDGDSFSDWQEVLAGSNPLESTSVPGPVRPALVHLDATKLETGPLSAWPNNGTLGGVFNSPANAVPRVETVQGVKGVRLNPSGTAQYYTGPAAPSFLTGNSSRTIEAWILNPVAADEETIVSWARRGGPDGSNMSFNHGLNASFGAVGHWGAGPDLGWGDAANVKRNQWTYVVYTYDGATQTARVYADGLEANAETFANPLNTFAVDTLGRPLPIRVGSQNEANGNPTGGLRGTMTIAEIRIYDRALDEATILNNFNAGTDKFGLVDYDNDGLPTYFERQFSFLNEREAADAARDQDNDGLTNLREFQAGTILDNPDSDGDGLSDGAEVNRAAGATNPLNPDTDQDGLSDRVETGTGTFLNASNTGTDPLIADTDLDGFADGQEVFHASNPLAIASVPNFSSPIAMVNLDATALAAGPLGVWTNTGPLGGVFRAPDSAIPNVESVQGVKGVTLDGNNHFYTGPAAPIFLAANGSRTIEAWIHNPAAANEETIFAWGRRGGPNGSNNSFNHGLNETFGAVGHWGAGPDVGWGGAANVRQGQWTHVAYTYDALSQTARVYSDGTEVNSEVFLDPLNTHVLDTVNRPLPFRVGSQNDADGGATGGLRGSMSIGRIRVYDQALSAAAIAAKVNEEKAFFAAPPPAVKLEGVTVDRAAGSVTFTWTVEAGKSYAVEASTNFSTWSQVAAGLTAGRFTETLQDAARFYRLRVQ